MAYVYIKKIASWNKNKVSELTGISCIDPSMFLCRDKEGNAIITAICEYSFYGLRFLPSLSRSISTYAITHVVWVEGVSLYNNLLVELFFDNDNLFKTKSMKMCYPLFYKTGEIIQWRCAYVSGTGT